MKKLKSHKFYPTSSTNYLKTGILFSLFFSFLYFEGQVISKSVDYVDSLKVVYPDKRVLITNSDNELVFKIDESSGLLNVELITKTEFVALYPSQVFYAYKYYDQFSELTKDKITKSNRKTLTSKECGDFEREGIFHHDSKVCKYAFQTKEKGDVVLLESHRKTFDARYFARVFFSDLYPVLNYNLQIKVPSDVNISIETFNFELFNISSKDETDPSTDEKTISFEANNLLAFKEDATIPGYSYYYPHILVIPESYFLKGKQQVLFGSDLAVYNWYNSFLEDDAGENGKLNELANSIVNSNDPDSLKIEKVFKWVQKNIRYIAFEYGIDGYKPDNALNVLNKKYGDCKGMTNLLVQLLRSLGIDARYCWLSTSNVPYGNVRIPSPAADNHMICAVKSSTGFLYLDATNKYAIEWEIPEWIQDKTALIDDGMNYIINKVPKKPQTGNSINQFKSVSLKSDTMYFAEQWFYTGETRSQLQYLLNENLGSSKEDVLKEMLSNWDNKVDIVSMEVDDLQNVTDTLVITVNKKAWNKVVHTGNMTIVPIDTHGKLNYETIDTTRNYLYYIGDRVINNLHINLSIPIDLEVDYLPENTSFIADGFAYHFNYKKVGGIVKYSRSVSINTSFIKPEQISSWNTFLKQYNKQCEEMIVFTEK